LGRRRGSVAELGKDEDDDIIRQFFEEFFIVFHWFSHDDAAIRISERDS